MSTFHGKKLVNIREYYSDDSGDLKPGRKGEVYTMRHGL